MNGASVKAVTTPRKTCEIDREIMLPVSRFNTGGYDATEAKKNGLYVRADVFHEMHTVRIATEWVHSDCDWLEKVKFRHMSATS